MFHSKTRALPISKGFKNVRFRKIQKRLNSVNRRDGNIQFIHNFIISKNYANRVELCNVDIK